MIETLEVDSLQAYIGINPPDVRLKVHGCTLWWSTILHALMVLIMMSWSCWRDSDITDVDSMVCLLTCPNLDACGALPRDVNLGKWVSLWLYWTVFCVCASTLFMREIIYISFSSTTLVSLVITQSIFANCSSTNEMFIIIIDIVTKKEEIKELEWLEELFSFDISTCDLECELVIELESTTKEGDLSLNSFNVEKHYSLLWRLWPFTPY